MSSYDAFDVGLTFETPTRVIETHDAETFIRLGGFTHPLFTDPAYAAASPFGRTPLPGQAILLMMGGLIEQTDRFDETTIALLGFDDVRFLAPAFPGDEIHVEASVLTKMSRAESKKGMVVMHWRCVNSFGDAVVEATAKILFRR